MLSESENKKLDEITNKELRQLCSKSGLHPKGGKLEMYYALKKAGKDPFGKAK